MIDRVRSVRLSALALCTAAATALSMLVTPAMAAAADIVLYASEAAVRKGHWSPASSSSAAGGASMRSSDNGWSTTNAPQTSPSNYFEMTFDAPANTTYRVWLRLRAANDSKWNDSVWVQFSDSLLSNGTAVYRIGSDSGLLVNLERCNGCGTSGWGWMNSAYWLNQPTEVRFATSGTHTIRVQTREDGVEIDQIVLSPDTYRSGSPGQETNDVVVLSKSGSSTASASSTGTTPYNGTPISLPGTVQARDFDNGGNGVAYRDATPGNSGGDYRATDVDIQDNPEGGHNVGWIASGEWLKYSVRVASSGSYRIRLRTASPYSGRRVTVAFDRSGVSHTVTVPNTGSWTRWANVEFTATLSSGDQVLTLSFPDGGLNISRVEASAESTSSGSSGSSGTLSPYNGSPVQLPGTVEASRFDNGGQGVAYGDTTPGNSGGQFRNTDVDIERSSDGGYNIGWTAAGEWLNYTVSVSTAGSYTVQLKVASTSSGNSIQVGFNGPSSVWQAVSVPNTGGWQQWTTVNLPVTLGAGQQQMTLLFRTGGVNLRSITVTSSNSTSPEPSTGSGGSGGTIRVMTWNIHHGKRKDGGYDPAGQARYIASQNPHVVLLQEVQTWDENQPAKYKALLEQYTGVRWHVQWAPVTSSQWTEGNVVLTRLPVVSSTYHQMHATGDWDAMYSNRSVAETTVSVGGVNVHIFSTHLDYYNTSHRTAQLQDMMYWAEKFGPRRIVGGDFNSTPGTYWINTMSADYYDTWTEVTGSSSGGGTINGVRFDYLFWSKDSGASIQPTRVYVGSTSLSDHLPVIADYTIRP